MEITAQMAALEEEVKVLKGEIKSILEEIRSAVLARDNPFTAEGILPVFQPVQRSEPMSEASSEPETASQGPNTPPTTAFDVEDQLPCLVPAAPAVAAPESGDCPDLAPPPTMARGGPELAPVAPMAETPVPQHWSVATIASLIAWVDETTSRLGATHLHMILDLARFAGLLPPEAEEALLKVIKLASSRKDSATVSVNDTLVALRQLEAIFQGAESDDLSVLRRRRSAGRSR
jgi:hypothetical protein